MKKSILIFSVLIHLGCQEKQSSLHINEATPLASAPVKVNISEVDHSNYSVPIKKLEQCDGSCQNIKNHIETTRLNMHENILPKTGWIADRGVELLSPTQAKQVWYDYQTSLNKTKCRLPTLEYKNYNSVTSFFVFETDYIYLFAYNVFRKDSRNLSWMICHKTTHDKTLDSDFYETGYNIDDPTITGGDSCDSSSTTVKFRELSKTGTLFLEVLLSRCQDNENHHELLFHLDRPWLEEVNGSRMDMDYKNHPHQSWRWWYNGEKYTPRSYSWNKRGNASWERLLRKRVDFDEHTEYPMVLIHRKCRYDSKKRAVICNEYIKKRSRKLERYPNYINITAQDCKDSKKICINKRMIEIKELRKNGFTITEEQINQIKKILDNY